MGEQFQVHHTTVNRIYKKFLATGVVDRKPGSGCPQKTSERQDRILVKIVKSDPRKLL